MSDLIGLFIMLCVVAYFTNGKIDSSRVKKWWGEDNGKK